MWSSTWIASACCVGSANARGGCSLPWHSCSSRCVRRYLLSPVQLANSDIKLHGAIYNGAAKCVSSIQAAYNKAAQRCSNQNPPALYLTGSESLPMLYHIESSILTCSRQAIRLVEGMHCAPFLKSWQPAIHCQMLL